MSQAEYTAVMRNNAALLNTARLRTAALKDGMLADEPITAEGSSAKAVLSSTEACGAHGRLQTPLKRNRTARHEVRVQRLHKQLVQPSITLSCASAAAHSNTCNKL
jgi:hypothetical protein